MHNRVLAPLFAFVLAGALPLQAQEAPLDQTSLVARIGAVLDSLSAADEFSGVVVLARGNSRVFARAYGYADREKRVDWLRRTVETYGWHLHAFVLMSNHEHLFVQTPESNLSAGMQYLGGSYSSYFNRRHRRSGHLFQGRFRGHLIEEEGYFLEVSRYVHLNPVRAKMVPRPEDWQWSSYAGYRRVRDACSWMTYDRVLGEFGGGASDERRHYRRFVEAGPSHKPWAVWCWAPGTS